MPQAIPAAIAALSTAVAQVAASAAFVATGSFAVAGATASIALAVVPLAVTLGVTTAFSALTAPKVGQTAAGTQIQWQADPSGAVPYVIGRTGTSGSLAFRTATGEHNKYSQTLTILSAAGPVKSIGAFKANDEAVAFTADANEGAAGRYLNRMWFKSRLGGPDTGGLAWTATGSKDTPADHGGTPALISAGGLSGLAADLWALEYDTKVYPTGLPKRLVVVEGVRVYDPRLDSTYPGGSGPQRASDETTWSHAGFENPALHALSFALGRTANGVRTLGLHAPPAALDIPAFVEWANICDLHGWKAGGVVYSTDGKRDVLRAMCDAGSARLVPMGAKISVVVDAPRVSLATLTGDDVVGEASIATAKPARTAPNTVWPRYREEAQGWQVTATAQPVAVSAYYGVDGGPRSTEYEWRLVQSADQVATLARYKIENAREFGPITLPCKPRWMGYRPGDCITINEPAYGLNGQKCIVLTRSVDPATMVCTLTLQSETDGKHAYALGETADPPPLPGVTGRDRLGVVAPPAENWLAYGGVTGTGEQSLPVILVTGYVKDPAIRDVLVDYRMAGSTVWTEAEVLPAPKAEDVALVHELRGLAPDTGYVVGIRHRTVLGVISDRLELGTDAQPIVTGELTVEQIQAIIDGVHLAAATGGNALVDTDFYNASRFWGLLYDETGLAGAPAQVDLYGHKALRRALTGTPAAGKVFGVGAGYGANGVQSTEAEVRFYGLPCKAGDKIEASSYFACAGLSRVNAEVYFWNAAGTAIQPPVEIAPFVTSFPELANPAGGIASLPRAGGWATAPTGAAYATLQVIGFTSGAANPYLTLFGPVLRIAQAGAAELAPFQGGVAIPGADKTALNTAPNIVGQGGLATASTVGGAQITASTGGNGVVDASFNLIPQYWSNQDNNTGLPGVWSQGSILGRPCLRVQISGTPVSGTACNAGFNAPAATIQKVALPVQPGQRVEAGVSFTGSGAGLLRQNIRWWKADGSYLTDAIPAPWTDFSLLSGPQTSFAGLPRLTHFATVPALAAYASPLYQVEWNGGANPFAIWALPLLRIAGAAQTEPSPYTAGLDAEVGSNVTQTNTAAAIAQQGPGATATSFSFTGGGTGVVGVTNVPTVLTTAGGVSSDGQTFNGAKLTAASVGFLRLAGSATRLYNDDGTTGGNMVFADGTAARRSDLLTSIGTAYSFAGRGDLAGLSSLGFDGGYLTGVPLYITAPYRDAYGRLRATYMVYGGSGDTNATLDSLKPGEVNANVTETRTAKFFDGQGLLSKRDQVIFYGSPGAAQILLGGIPYGLQQIDGGGYLAADGVRNGGVQLKDRWAAENGADATFNHNAAGYSGQTAWGTFSGSTNRLLYIADTGQMTNGLGLPYMNSVGIGATYSPRFPLSSTGPGNLTVQATSIRIVGSGGSQVISTPYRTYSVSPGAEVFVVYNRSTGDLDVVTDPTDVLSNPTNYVALGSQLVQQSGGAYPAPAQTPALGGGGGFGGGEGWRGNPNTQVE